MTATIFHLSLPVHDLVATQQFYCSVLGALRGRATEKWIDLIVFGHQLTFHERPEQVVPREPQSVQHFGAILAWDEWEFLCAKVKATGHPFLVSPTVFAQGTDDEHAKVVLPDPSGHVLELKAYRDITTVIPGHRPNNSFKPKPLRGSAQFRH